MAPRVRGKILACESGRRFIVVEQKGKDIIRGKHKSLHEAEEAGAAGIGVDRILLQRAMKYECASVVVFFEDLRRMYVAPIERFFEEGKSSTKTNWQGRALRVVGFENLLHTYLGADLRPKRKRASA